MLIEKPLVPRHAIIGIVAVSLAAINSTLGSGMIGAGLEDLRGAWHLGIDDAAYVPTAFNAAQMFMGPLSVMLAARFGHRRILLYAGFIYVFASLLLPLVPHIVPITTLLVIGGLASGTFYPLCLSFIARNLPLSLVTFGIAAYNLDLLATNHVVQALEGFYMDHFSWHWIFWNQAIFSLPMLLAVYIGIPHTPKEQLLPDFDYRGILYVSGSLTLLYIALDQGERLDWYNNGLINGLVLCGTLLLIAAILRRKFYPNPFLDFSYLRSRNILILGLIQVLFRSLLLRITFIIPIFFETLQQYRGPETGSLLTLSIWPFLIALPITAHFMRKIRVRDILLIGFTVIGINNLSDTHLLSTWKHDQFITSQMFCALGICLVGMGAISGIVFEGRVSGAYANRAGAYSQGAFFQIARLFGSVASATAFRRFILYRQHFWQTKLVSTLQPTWPFDERTAYLGIALAPQAAGPLQAQATGTELISKSVQAQSFTLAIDDSFMLMFWVCVLGLLCVAIMTKIPLPDELLAVDAPVKKPENG
jgi:DHA2 family multidrug resistance protein